MSFLVSLVLSLATQDPRSNSDASAIAKDLAAAIALVAPKERHAAVHAIVKRKAINVATARAAAVEALVFDPARGAPDRPDGPGAIGSHIERAPIWADGKAEDTELVTYVPASYDAARPAPLLVAFHGTGGSGRGQDALWRAVADKLGMLVIAPSEAGPNEGYLFSKRERDAAFGAVRWMKSHFNVDDQRVFASGISRGGHLTWDLALRRPDTFAAIAPLIGCPRWQVNRDQNNMRFLENVVHLPIRDLQGSKDDPGLVQNVHDAFAKLEALHADDAKLIEFAELGHDFKLDAVDWLEFFGRGRRNEVPDKIVINACDLDEARAFWVEITAFGKSVSKNLRLEFHAAEWSKLDAQGQRQWVEDQVQKGNARLEVERTARGHFRAKGKGVSSFRILLTSEMFDVKDGVEVEWNGKTIKKKPALDPELLLDEFVERIDRTFLPVASVEVP